DAIASIHVKSVTGPLNIDVSGVFYDSRKVSTGGVFCALKGVGSDGHEFIESAIENGAVAIVSEKPYPAEFTGTWLHVADARGAMGRIAANLEGNPSLEFPVIGITGTNGKTTTAFLVHYLLQSVLHRAGMIGTVRYATGDEFYDAPHTTPEAPDLHRLLREMRDADCRGVAMEVSSHGLAQKRVEGVSFNVGVFTNLSQDHLDYHSNMDEYFQAKALLFSQIENESAKKGVSIVNSDDVYGDRLLKMPFEQQKMLSYGRSVSSDFLIGDIRSDLNGTQFSLKYKERSFLVKTPLIGEFNVYNTVAAIASANAVGLNLREVIAKMADAPQVPGRLEAVSDRQINYRVFVDYAHTPDALVNVLRSLRGLSPNRIITVFGCGGDRDMLKRPQMALAAEEGSDFCVLTSDNPRTEDPQQILDDAEKGFKESEYDVIENRRRAIAHAIDIAGERDIVLIAGKGHEAYQEVNGIRHAFDDRKEARKQINLRSEKGEG
ncbi:UDP-N-acetylmuramoyl-L-alanyl-D-glutamate--2,6-diaminopimelate ligase, partial [Verrucomicrobiales bacterium]|nr:UDP-N-acetylmuramoyl-L-alanyl-D-glutamate--2,6-diaminopimelate ligase [Verrucomicrobiales bacterium]